LVKIDSSLGNGFGASVNNLNKLEVRSITESQGGLHSRGGLRFNIVTSKLNVDDADENAILYFKNNEEQDFIITGYGINLGTSTGGSGGEWELKSIRNPTTGTIIDSGNAITPLNFNAGSAKTLSATLKEKSAANQTFTNGDDPWLHTIGTGSGRTFISTDSLVLPPGTAIGFTFEAQPSNTSQNLVLFFSGYRNSLITTDVVKA